MCIIQADTNYIHKNTAVKIVILTFVLRQKRKINDGYPIHRYFNNR